MGLLVRRVVGHLVVRSAQLVELGQGAVLPALPQALPQVADLVGHPLEVVAAPSGAPLGAPSVDLLVVGVPSEVGLVQHVALRPAVSAS